MTTVCVGVNLTAMMSFPFGSSKFRRPNARDFPCKAEEAQSTTEAGSLLDDISTMLRTLGLSPTLQLYRNSYTSFSCSRFLSFGADVTDGPTEEEQIAARQWLASFNPGTIPRNLCEISYSRSSGPGGQNVNK